MSRSDETFRIIIVGAGIIGLTTACTLLKEYANNENIQITIISESFSPHTTGDISAGYWEPYGLKKLDERTLRWAGYAYNIFLDEYFSSKAARAGVMKMTSYVLKGYDSQKDAKDHVFIEPEFSKLVRHFRRLDEYEIGLFNHLRPLSGFVMSSIVVEMSKYLPQLHRFLARDHRVKFLKKKLHSISELKDRADVIINCSGLASRYLVGDQTIRPARGQVIRVHAPWIKSVFAFDTDEGFGYVIPQSDSVVLGGTFQLNNWSTTPIESDTRKILRMCSKAFPALEQVRHGKVQVGLRPYRDDGVRLEHEKTQDGMDIIHCYGHSGSGVTLSWGCAKDVVDIVKRLFSPSPKYQTDLPEHEQLWRLASNVEYLVIKAKL